jgi:alpha-beta hydrolase superfamily lysophospholipase
MLQLEQAYLPGVEPDGLFYRLWVPTTPVRAVLMICHGLGEHSGRYQRLAEFILPHGFAVAALDLPGHGKSAGRRAYIDDFDEHADALRRFHAQLIERFSALPFFLLGHSMGGLVAAGYLPAGQGQLRGAILSGACLKIDGEPAGLMRTLLSLLSRCLPRMGVLKLDSAAISRDPAEVAAYEVDPLVFRGKVPARSLMAMFTAMNRVRQLAAQVTLPMLILHGGQDRLTASQGSRDYQQGLSSADSVLTIYSGLFHEIINEPEREQVMQDILDWLQSHMPVTQ